VNNIRTSFSIKDLENFSGIKAHTIRIWEKRYNLLEPSRTDSNIRNYSLESFKKLLNVTFLYNNGFKISKIASFCNDQILEETNKVVSEKASKNQFINEMKLAMLNFDSRFFEECYQKLKLDLPFGEIFINYFIPFLDELGLLWQTNSINPAHEHFISNLIKQKILVNTEGLSDVSISKKGFTFVLFLPDNEMHDLGLSFLNYELLLRGYKTIYLGGAVPIDAIEYFTATNENLIFISYFTIEPAMDYIQEYLEYFNETILQKCDSKLWLLGKKARDMEKDTLPEKILVYDTILEVLEMLDC